MRKRFLQTITGWAAADDLGIILPHEHLFTDLRGPDTPGYAIGEPELVGKAIEPFLADAYRSGITALIECSTGGVGRNIPVLQWLGKLSPIHIVAPTGVYRDAYIPADLRKSTMEELAHSWIKDLTVGIEDTGVKAGFIKIAMSDDGPTLLEQRSLRAAAFASKATGAAVASHTVHGLIARREIDILESEGMDLTRFVWVHANAEPDRSFHREMARRGAYIEFDGIGQSPEGDRFQLESILELIESGFTEKILLSHDAGWYDPAHPDGKPSDAGIRGYTALVTDFIPALHQHGISDEVIWSLTHTNPVNAFGYYRT